MKLLKILWCRFLRHPRYVIEVERELGVWVKIYRCPKCRVTHQTLT